MDNNGKNIVNNRNKIVNNEKNILKKISNVNTRTPFRIGRPSAVFKTIIPLCSRFPDEGTVDFYSSREIDNYEGLFSFVLYYNKPPDEFKKTIYYIGLLIYVEIIHRMPFFENYGIVVYTDESTYEILRPLLMVYPKIILAIAHWEQFRIASTISGTVMRCLRFQALEAFPNSHIIVRDADSIFVSEIEGLDYLYSIGYKTTDDKTGAPIEDYREYLIEKIGAWEKQFIEMWFREGSPLLFGVQLGYVYSWHADFPFIWATHTDKNANPNYVNRIKNSGGMNQNIGIESGGRFKYYAKKHGDDLFIQAPAGIYAGFTNFLNTRPTDLWLLSFDYIQTRYKLITQKNGGQNISNSVLWIEDVGKDERILIFAILIKYWSLCFFLRLIIDNKKKLSFIQYNKFFNPSYRPLVNIGTVEYKFNSQTRKKHFKMGSYMLFNDFLPQAFNLKLDPETFNSYKKRWESNENDWYLDKYFSNFFNETDIGKPINLIYREHFSKFAPLYKSWLHTIMSKTDTEINKIIAELMKLNSKGDGYKYAHVNLHANNFYEQPTRILPSRLPPLLRKTRKNRKH